MRRAGFFVLGTVAVFVASFGVSMAAYPGGSWLDRRATSHDLWRNFMCDLLAPVAINGEPNPVGSRAMMLGMGVLALGLAVYWWSLAALFSPGLQKATRVCAVISTLGLLTVPLTPPTESYELHAAAIFSGGIPAFGAWILALVGLWQAPPMRRHAQLGVTALVAVGVGFLLYARDYFWLHQNSMSLPVSHRIATVFFFAWVIGVCSSLLRGRAPDAAMRAV